MRCPSSVVVNVLASYLYDPSSFPLSTVYERLYISTWTRGFSSGTLASSHINDPLELTTLSTIDISISCRRCL